MEPAPIASEAQAHTEPDVEAQLRDLNQKLFELQQALLTLPRKERKNASAEISAVEHEIKLLHNMRGVAALIHEGLALQQECDTANAGANAEEAAPIQESAASEEVAAVPIEESVTVLNEEERAANVQGTKMIAEKVAMDEERAVNEKEAVATPEEGASDESEADMIVKEFVGNGQEGGAKVEADAVNVEESAVNKHDGAANIDGSKEDTMTHKDTVTIGEAAAILQLVLARESQLDQPADMTSTPEAGTDRVANEQAGCIVVETDDVPAVQDRVRQEAEEKVVRTKARADAAKLKVEQAARLQAGEEQAAAEKRQRLALIRAELSRSERLNGVESAKMKKFNSEQEPEEEMSFEQFLESLEDEPLREDSRCISPSGGQRSPYKAWASQLRLTPGAVRPEKDVMGRFTQYISHDDNATRYHRLMISRLSK